MRAYGRFSISVILDPDEEYKADTPTGPIMVRQVRDAYGSISIRGFAIKKDGTQGSIQRDGHCKFIDLPVGVQEAYLEELNRMASEIVGLSNSLNVQKLREEMK